MEKRNSVYIATSIDGLIADNDGGVDWLHSTPNPTQSDLGYGDFMAQIDALIMGRNTFETVCSFDCDWPYNKPVYVLSNSLKKVDAKYKDKVFLVNGSLTSVLMQIHQNKHYRLYIDGGKTIQSFLNEDLIDELILTTIPILLGGGVALFDNVNSKLNFELKSSKILLGQLVQRHYIRK